MTVEKKTRKLNTSSGKEQASKPHTKQRALSPAQGGRVGRRRGNDKRERKLFQMAHPSTNGSSRKKNKDNEEMKVGKFIKLK